MKVHWANKFPVETLGIAARPRGDDWLEDDIKNLKRQEVSILISLLEPIEEDELGLNKTFEICCQNTIRFIHFPIPDRGLPREVEKFLALVDEINQLLINSHKIVIHCRMGIGRSSLLAAAVLIKGGTEVKGIFEYLSKVRSLEVPDTEEQKNWVINLLQ